jgi:predicted nucleic acid-binding protein
MVNNSYPLGENVYIDANFLVAYFIPNHIDVKKAGKLFAKLLINKNKFNLTALTLDESFMGIVFELRRQQGDKTLPTSKFFDNLKQVLSTLLGDQRFIVRQYEKSLENGSMNALQNIKDYNLKPRDAFHLSYMQDLEIKYMVSFDDNFNKVSTISVINS